MNIARRFPGLSVRTGIRAGTPGGAAGGAGGGSGSGEGGDGGEGGAAAFSAEQVAEINKIVGGRVGQELRKFQTSFTNDITSKITETISGSLGEIDKLVDTKISALKPGGAGAGAGGTGGEGAGAGGAKPVTDTPEYKGLQKKLEELTGKVTATEQREKAALENAKNVRLRQKVAEQLVKKGIDPTRVRLAVGQLIDVDKRVRFDGEGENEALVIRDGQDDVDFDTGADAWLKTDEAKIYLPPRGAAGSGDRGGGRRASGTAAPGKKGAEASYEDVGNFVTNAFGSLPGVGGARSGE